MYLSCRRKGCSKDAVVKTDEMMPRRGWDVAQAWLQLPKVAGQGSIRRFSGGIHRLNSSTSKQRKSLPIIDFFASLLASHLILFPLLLDRLPPA